MKQAAIFALFVFVGLAASVHAATPLLGSPQPRQFLVEFRGNRLPADLSARIASLGGTIVDTMPGIGVAVVANLTDGSASALRAQADVFDVTDDELMDLGSPDQGPGRISMPFNPVPSSAADPTSAFYYAFQWDKRAIQADKAWQAGYLGSPDVRIAIIDTGIDPVHPELAGLIDASRSVSFCPDETPFVQQEFPGYPAWTDLYGHGTFVAAITSSNSDLLAGVASHSSLMAIKALGILPCHWSGTIRGIYYAADHGADVINISSGALVRRHLSARNFRLYHLAVQYALVKGVSAVVVAAGNSAVDLDHSVDLASAYCDVAGVICVSATGPTDSGPLYVGPFQNVDASAFYTNFGMSAIDVAAPGGNLAFDSQGNIVGDSWVFSACATTDRWFDNDGNIVPGFCTSLGITTAGSIGTSFAAPHVSGLAALLVSQLGRGHAAQVNAAIGNSADDLGKPGIDPYYGRGRINVARALGLQ